MKAADYIGLGPCAFCGDADAQAAELRGLRLRAETAEAALREIARACSHDLLRLTGKGSSDMRPEDRTRSIQAIARAALYRTRSIQAIARAALSDENSQGEGESE